MQPFSIEKKGKGPAEFLKLGCAMTLARLTAGRRVYSDFQPSLVQSREEFITPRQYIALVLPQAAFTSQDGHTKRSFWSNSQLLSVHYDHSVLDGWQGHLRHRATPGWKKPLINISD